jgi:DNA polymerase III psi subunit
MNKNLGILLFGNEMIFNPQKIEQLKPNPVEAEVKEIAREVIPNSTVVKKIQASVSNKIVIITETFIEEEEVLLTKILAACTLELKDVLLINFSKEKNLIEESLFGHQNTIISFGVGPQKLSLNYTLIPYQIKVLESHKILLSDSLKVLNTNTLLKKNLWMSLQKMLNPAN